jgi:hypothetical protein
LSMQRLNWTIPSSRWPTNEIPGRRTTATGLGAMVKGSWKEKHP